MSSRLLPPPGGPPPAYDRVVRKVYPYSLRPVLIVTSVLGIIWGIALGVASIRDRGDDGETSKEKIFDLVLAILFFVVAVIEAFGVIVALLQRLALARMLTVAAPLGVAVACAAQLIAVILHFSFKQTLINQCVADNSDLEVWDGDETRQATDDEINEVCSSSWSRGTWTVFIWLLVTAILAFLFAGVALSYYRQLLDPSLVRSRNTQPQAFAMQSGSYYPPPTQNQDQSWMVPPYPGPPGPGHAPPPPGFEKSDYHPEAEWAQSEPLGYAPPPGAPPSRSRGGDEFGESSGLRAQEEAWLNAQRTGPTAHLTGHGVAREADEEDGFVVPNREEDEAWEQAREGGATAHLTGQSGQGGQGGQGTGKGRRTDGEV